MSKKDSAPKLCTSRMKLLLIFLAILLLGVPVWYKTTQTYRTQMPLEDIDAIRANFDFRQDEWRVTLRIHVSDDVEVNMADLKGKLMTKLSNAFYVGQGNFSSPLIKFTVAEVSNLPSTFSVTNLKEKGDGTLDELGASYLGSSPSLKVGFGNFDIFVIGSGSEKAKVILGKHRHAFVRVPKSLSTEKVSELISETATVSYQDIEVLTARHPDDLALLRLKLAPTYRFIFLLANNNPEKVRGWEIKEALEEYFEDVLATAATFAPNITVETKVVHYAGIDASPKYNDAGRFYYFEKERLPYFIDRSSWGVEQSPMKIVLNDGKPSKTNGFLVPQWGGVVIAKTLPSKEIFSASDLSEVFGVWLSQLRECFGAATPAARSTYLSSRLGGVEVVVVPASSAGFSGVETDLISLQRLLQSQRSAVSTLQNFANLMVKLPTIPVEDYIGDLLTTSLSSLNASRMGALAGRFMEALNAALESLRLAERAFFDKQMLAMLYFPEDHKFAIYVPLFLPVFYPVFYGIYREIQRRRKKKAELKKKNRENKEKND